jgi:nucleoside-diphosphate-sugar epimerase
MNQPYTIPLTGVIGLVYVDDVAAACEIAVRTKFDGAHTFNLSGNPVEIETIVEKIRQIEPGARVDCKGDPLPSIATVKDEYYNNLLELPAATSLEKGLQQTIEFYRGIYSLANA